VLALSSWTWLVVVAFALLSVGVLIRATLVLIGRIKTLMRTLSRTSETLNESLEQMRTELGEASEGLAEIRRRREEHAP
jgi:ABC-type multidrug transport system fused ATPase/permease subunit